MTEAEAHAAGFELEDYEDDTAIEVWAANLPAFNLFRRIGTRWVYGMNGPVGLRYEAIYPLLDRLNLSPEDWDLMLSDIETMEHAALTEMNRKE